MIETASNPDSFRLGPALSDWLWQVCAPFKNAEAMRHLGRYLLRKHSGERLDGAFASDRRALAACVDLGLSERVIRSAIENLVAVGFMDRPEETPKASFSVAAGGVRRAAVKYRFGAVVRKLFAACRALFSKRPGYRLPKEENRLGTQPVAAFVEVAFSRVKTYFFPSCGAAPEPRAPIDPNSALGRKLAALGVGRATAGVPVSLDELHWLHHGERAFR